MAVYYGVVRDNRVVFVGEAPLAEGTRVEVRPRQPEDDRQARAESAVKERLRAAGILTPTQAPEDQDDTDEEFEPMTVSDRPLSEQIIDERR
ncbi:MAG TPA: hypothetical protein VHB98_16440 [Chloroflexota bacterium]|jgi:hypothetical protein|nr:hypothetical protein [Chloroflexota bacterium]